MPDRIVDLFDAIFAGLANDDFFLDHRLFGDDGLFTVLGHLDGLIAEQLIAAGRSPLTDRTPLYVDVLLMQRDLLMDGLLDNIGSDAHSAAVDFAFAHTQPFFHDRNPALVACVRLPGCSRLRSL